MIIDAHQHVYWHGKDAAGLIADMDENGIDKAWLLNWEIPPEEDVPKDHHFLNPEHIRPDGTHAGIPLCDIVKAKNLYPDRFILGYAPHPLQADAVALFESAYKMYNARICGEVKARVLYDDPRCINLFRKAGELGCPVVLHIDVPFLPDDNGEVRYMPNWYGGTIVNLERAMQACPETNFLGHAPGFWREISADADTTHEAYPKGPVIEGGKVWQMFETYPNIYGDISAGSGLGALKRDVEHAKKFITTFADRLLFARDFFGSDWQDFLNSLELPKKIMDKIYYQNAQRLIKE